MTPPWSGLEQGMPWVGRNASWENLVSLSQLVQALGAVRSHWGLFCRAVTWSLLGFYFFKKPVYCRALVRKNEGEKALRSEGHRSLWQLWAINAPIVRWGHVHGSNKHGGWMEFANLLSRWKRGQTFQKLTALIQGLLPEDWERQPLTISKGPGTPHRRISAPDLRLPAGA